MIPTGRGRGGGRGVLGMGVADVVVLNLEYPDAGGKGGECRDDGQQSTFHTFPPRSATTNSGLPEFLVLT